MIGKIAAALIALLMALLSAPLYAHNDGEIDGHTHRYRPNNGNGGSPVAGCPNWRDDPDEAFDDGYGVGGCIGNHSGGKFCESTSFHTTPGRWAHTYSTAASCLPINTTTVYMDEFHCQPFEEILGCTTIADSHECRYDGEYDGLDGVIWIADANPLYINVQDDDQDITCLWKRYTSTAGGCGYTVVYEPTGWYSADEDDFTQARNDGSAVGGPPNTCSGADEPVWPWTNVPPGEEPEDDTARCPAGTEVFVSWPWEGGAGEAFASICTSQGCEAVVDDVGVCLESQGFCGGTVIYTGLRCDGSEDGYEGTDDGASTGSGDGQIVSELQRIYGRLGAIQAADVLGNAAIISALGGIEDAIEEGGAGGGGGECEEESCDGTVPTLDPADTVATTTTGFLDRVAAAPIVAAVTDIATSWPEAGSCPTWTSDPIAALDGEVLTVDVQCELWPDIQPIIFSVMLAFWVILGALIILRA